MTRRNYLLRTRLRCCHCSRTPPLCWLILLLPSPLRHHQLQRPMRWCLLQSQHCHRYRCPCCPRRCSPDTRAIASRSARYSQQSTHEERWLPTLAPSKVCMVYLPRGTGRPNSCGQGHQTGGGPTSRSARELRKNSWTQAVHHCKLQQPSITQKSHNFSQARTPKTQTMDQSWMPNLAWPASSWRQP